MGLPCLQYACLRDACPVHFIDNLVKPAYQGLPEEFSATPFGWIPGAFANDDSRLEAGEEITQFRRRFPISLAQYIFGDEIQFENIVSMKRILRRNDHLSCVFGQWELAGSKKRLAGLQ
mmetsp:Transcript_1163/g.2596  ORF Transcript_1163/g.2596 Transcript_1163/m.2596 type:complete len:119 (-) Transcript_1163:1398-1754(-)